MSRTIGPVQRAVQAVRVNHLWMCVQVDKSWSIGALIAMTIPLVILLAAVGLSCLIVWINLHSVIWRGKALWKKKSASGKSLRVRMLGEWC